MKILKLSFILVLVIFLMAGKASGGKFATRLSIFQNDVETPIKDYSETLEIDNKKFSLRFYNKKYNSIDKKFYAAQVAAFLDKSDFDKVKVGLSKSDLPCFEPGSGMAPDRSGKYEALIFSNSGHHYLMYKNSESNTRLNLLGMSKKLFRLGFEINALYYDNKEVKMEDTDLKEFYIAFLIDKNLNGIIEKGELYKLTIKIK